MNATSLAIQGPAACTGAPRPARSKAGAAGQWGHVGRCQWLCFSASNSLKPPHSREGVEIHLRLSRDSLGCAGSRGAGSLARRWLTLGRKTQGSFLSSSLRAAACSGASLGCDAGPTWTPHDGCPGTPAPAAARAKGEQAGKEPARERPKSQSREARLGGSSRGHISSNPNGPYGCSIPGAGVAMPTGTTTGSDPWIRLPTCDEKTAPAVVTAGQLPWLGAQRETVRDVSGPVRPAAPPWLGVGGGKPLLAGKHRVHGAGAGGLPAREG